MKVEKVIFLDVDGVLNSYNSLMDDESLEDALVKKVADLSNEFDARIVLSSAWRIHFPSAAKVMERLGKFDAFIFSYTHEGVRQEVLKDTPWANVPRDPKYDWDDEICFDRGAEIAAWLIRHPTVKNFVIFDDESRDIIKYFPDNLVVTNFNTGVTDADIIKAKEILERN